MNCRGLSRPLDRALLEECPYLASAGDYCYFHSKVVEGLITFTDVVRHREDGRVVTEPRKTSWTPVRWKPHVRDPFDVLLEEWDLAGTDAKESSTFSS